MLTSQIGLAQSSSDPLETAIFKNGIWLGGGASWSDIDSSSGSLNYVDDSFGYNLGIGYQFLNYFGVVAKWKDLSEFEDTVAGTSVDIDVDGYTLGLGAGYPINKRIAVNAGIGFYDFDFDDNLSGSSGEDDSGAYLSASVSSAIGNIVVQPTFVIYDTDLADLWSLELNFYWKFELGN
jgi:opacity protein-like surface antigen